MKLLAKATSKQEGDLYIYDEIGQDWFGEGLTAKSVQQALDGLGAIKTLNVYVNSPGGAVFDGVAIYNQLARFDAKKIVHIDALAASIASVISMVGDEIRIADNAMMMIHDPWGMAIGTSDEMRKTADTMDQVRETLIGTYAKRTGCKPKDIADWMTAETWMDAKTCVDRGFADSVTIDEPAIVKNASRETQRILAKFRNTPQALLQRPAEASSHRLNAARMQQRVTRFSRGASAPTA